MEGDQQLPGCKARAPTLGRAVWGRARLGLAGHGMARPGEDPPKQSKETRSVIHYFPDRKPAAFDA